MVSVLIKMHALLRIKP
ncbi:UNVERIFIED_CONTAM: hypothetical protein GTU68_065999 [Idotea baltica]|nr:hypothetical protein [Idotea baltica]